MALSLVLDAFKKAQARKQSPMPTTRVSARQSTAPGYARGALGVYGSRPFKGRDPYASERKELEMMHSPVFQQYVRSLGKGMV